jgi:hypothetical protein
MNSRERIIAALEGQKPDHVPFCPFLAYVWDHFPEQIRNMGQLAFQQMIGADPLWRGAPCPVEPASIDGLRYTELNEDGRTVTIIETPVGNLRKAVQTSQQGNTTFLVEHPLKTAEHVKIAMWIEERTRYVYNPGPMQGHLTGPGREGVSLGMLIPRRKSAYQSLVEQWVGTEELVYMVADFPEVVKGLWEIMVQNDLEAVRLAAQSEYSYFTTWEDSSTQNYSPAQYDQFIGSEIGGWCRILAQSGKRYVQHACGHTKALLGRMRRHGVFAVESISPPPTGNVSIREARKVLGRDVGIIGGIEPTQFLQLSERDLGAYVESVIADAAGGPFILANSDSCPPGVTVEKMKLAAEIAKRTPAATTTISPEDDPENAVTPMGQT